MIVALVLKGAQLSDGRGSSVLGSVLGGEWGSTKSRSVSSGRGVLRGKWKSGVSGGGLSVRRGGWVSSVGVGALGISVGVLGSA